MMGRRQATIGVLAAVLAVILGADRAASGQDIPAAEAVARVQAEAKGFAELEAARPQLRQLVLGCGLLIGHGWGRQQFAGDERLAAEAFVGFMGGEGGELLSQGLQGGPFTEPPLPYRDLIAAAYLHEGQQINEARKKPKERQYPNPNRMLSLTLSPAQQDACAAFHKAVIEQGRDALKRGFTTGRLSDADIASIRRYHIAWAMVWGTEVFLPMNFGMNARTPVVHPGQHGHQAMESLVGRPMMNLQLPLLETVLRRPAYSDAVDYGYMASWAVRPEGALEYLQPLAAHAPAKDEKGRAIAMPIQQAPPAGYIDLKTHGNGKPLALMMNDPVDGAPMQVGLAAFDVLGRIYGGSIQFLFVATGIHDREWQLVDFMTPGRSGVSFPGVSHTHAWSEEERARRLKNFLLLFPQVSVPCALDTMGQVAKESYIATGGANNFFLIGADGITRSANLDGFYMLAQMNLWELQIQRLLAGEPGFFGGVEDRSGRVPMRVKHPARVVGLLKDARVASVADGIIKVEAIINGKAQVIPLVLGPHARVENNGALADAGSLKAGQAVMVRFALADLLAADYGKLDPSEAFHEDKVYGFSDASGRQVTVRRVRDGYHDLFNYPHYALESDSRVPAQLPAFHLQAWDDAKMLKARRQNHHPRIWLCGRVQRVEDSGRCLTVERTSQPPAECKGYSFRSQMQKAGSHLQLNAEAAGRMAVLDGWAAHDDRLYTVLLDDATDLTINGLYSDDPRPIRAGDLVAVHHVAAQDAGRQLRPDLVRISRIPALDAQKVLP